MEMGKRVLIVEDDTPIREMVGQLLSEIGCDIASAPNGVEGLQALRSDGPFDLMLLDMGLPMMDGWELAKHMHEDGLDVPVLVMTAGRNARRAAQEVGAIGYIGKPFDIEELEGSVRQALANRDDQEVLHASYVPLAAWTFGRAAAGLRSWLSPTPLARC